MHGASPLTFKQFVCLFSAGDLVTRTVRTHSDLCCHSLIELQQTDTNSCECSFEARGAITRLAGRIRSAALNTHSAEVKLLCSALRVFVLAEEISALLACIKGKNSVMWYARKRIRAREQGEGVWESAGGIRLQRTALPVTNDMSGWGEGAGLTRLGSLHMAFPTLMSLFMGAIGFWANHLNYVTSVQKFGVRFGDSKDTQCYKRFMFHINAVLLNFLFIKDFWKKDLAVFTKISSNTKKIHKHFEAMLKSFSTFIIIK